MTDTEDPVTPATPAASPLARVGGRKFVLALLVIVGAFIEREVGNIDSTTLVQMVSAALGFFSAANVIQKFKSDK